MIIRCPKCGSSSIEKNGDGVVADIYRCQNCKTTFGYVGVKSPLSDLVVSMELEIKGFKSNEIMLKLGGPKGSRYLKKSCSEGEMTSSVVSEEDWNHLTDELFRTVYLDKWKKMYFDSSIIDGTRWTITVSFEKKHTLSIHGVNGFPILWNEMLDAFSSCLGNGVNLESFKR